MEATTDMFINVIQNHRIIYDKSLKDFKNTRKKDEAWKNIASQCRMDVDAAKKRYFSLRQKYCREKRNIEIRRRNKCQTRKYWVFYERLQFLDAFIQPRSTYTNDTMFAEDGDNPMHVNEDDVGDLEGCSVDASNIEIQLEEGIDISELNNIYREDENSEVQHHPNLQVIETTQNDQEISDDHQIDKNLESQRERIITERVISDYTGKESTVDYVFLPELCDNIDNNNVRDKPSAISTTNEHQRFPEAIDMDNYLSPHPTTSAQAMYPPLPMTRTVNRSDIINQLTPNNHEPSSVQKTDPKHAVRQDQAQSLNSTKSSNRTAPFQQTSAKLPAATTSKEQPGPKNAVRQDQVQSLNSTKSSNRTASSQQTRVNLEASTGSKDQRIEAIRMRMESCLTAITNKVTDKGQRSPHSPFLAYLGTKLPNVPKERLPELEREILDLVDHCSQ